MAQPYCGQGEGARRSGGDRWRRCRRRGLVRRHLRLQQPVFTSRCARPRRTVPDAVRRRGRSGQYVRLRLRPGSADRVPVRPAGWHDLRAVVAIRCSTTTILGTTSTCTCSICPGFLCTQIDQSFNITSNEEVERAVPGHERRHLRIPTTRMTRTWSSSMGSIRSNNADAGRLHVRLDGPRARREH